LLFKGVEVINLFQLVFWAIFGGVMLVMKAYNMLKIYSVGHLLQRFRRLAAKSK
jgi:hypothetical protein